MYSLPVADQAVSMFQATAFEITLHMKATFYACTVTMVNQAVSMIQAEAHAFEVT